MTVKNKPLKTAKAREDKDFRDEVSLTCACSRDLTVAELGKIFRARTKKQIEEFISNLNDAFLEYGIDSCLKKSHFLAQVGHESAQTRLLEESGITEEKEKKIYGGYKGRGLLQLTFKDAYEKYGDYVGKDFLGAKRTQVATPKYASDSAGWFWKVYKGVDLSEYAKMNDFIYLTQKINGAFNGWDDRLMLLNRAIESLLVNHCPNAESCPNTSKYSLVNSDGKQSRITSFAFGYWFDPETDAKKAVGITRSTINSLEGYLRFIELTREVSVRDKNKSGNFGFSTLQSMIDHADRRIEKMNEGG